MRHAPFRLRQQAERYGAADCHANSHPGADHRADALPDSGADAGAHADPDRRADPGPDARTHPGPDTGTHPGSGGYRRAGRLPDRDQEPHQ